MQTFYEPAREIPVYGQFDVIVVGGGCAGFSAAMAASRCGAKTLIVEKFAFFGGTATACLMANINGFRNQVNPDYLQTTKGIGEEMMLALKDIGGVGRSNFYNMQGQYDNTKGNLAFSLGINPEKFKFIALKKVSEAGVQILFHTYFCDTILDGQNVRGVIFENKAGRQAAFAKVVIDASGDADVSYHAGVPFWQTKHDEAKRLNNNLMYMLAGYQKVPEGLDACNGGGMLCLWGPNTGANNTLDGDEFTQAEIKARLEVYDHFEALKAKYTDLAEAEIVQTAPMLGVRQTRFIEGVYKITVDDVLGGKMFEDNIAMASKPIINYFGYRRYLEHEGYGIPYRCMLPQKASYLLVAGRCMSSDQPAYESWRSMGPCMSLGQAAGTAAALSIDRGVEPKELDIKALQARLIEDGAELGQNKITPQEA